MNNQTKRHTDAYTIQRNELTIWLTDFQKAALTAVAESTDLTEEEVLIRILNGFIRAELSPPTLN